MNLVGEMLATVIDKFNKRVIEDPKLKEELKDVRRSIVVQVSDGETWNFKLDNGHAGDLAKGGLENPDILVKSDRETLRQLWNGELRAMKALATRRVHVKASLEDMLRLRKLF